MTEKKPAVKMDNIVSYAKKNTKDTIAYVLIILGIVFALFGGGFYGGVLVGLVAGFYYGPEIIAQVKGVNSTIHRVGIPRALVLGGTILAFFIFAPGIFIGAAISAAITMLLEG